MTVSSSTARVVHTANGSSVFFSSAPIQGLTADNVVVTLTTPAGVTTTQVLGTDYTLSPSGVTFTTAPAAGLIVTIRRVVPLLQPDEFTTNSPFPAKIAENRFDQVVFGLQQATDDLTRAIRLPPADTVSSVLLPASARANRYLAFAPDGSLAYAVPQPAGPGATEAYWWGGTAGGTANALTISVGGPPTAYAEGQRFAFVVASNNTGAATLAVNGLTAKSIRRPDGSTLQAGDLKAGMLIGVTYDGTNFRLASAWATNAEAVAGTDNTVVMTPLRVVEAIDTFDRWRQIVSADLTNSTIINVTGFSLQNYRKVTVLLLGARLSSASSNIITGELYRNGSLVTTGYFFVRETAEGATMTVAASSNHPLFGLMSNGVNTNPLMSVIDIVQPSSTGDVVLYAYTVHRDSPNGNINNYRTGVLINGGSGWTDGVRITAPTAFVANAGRIVVMGLRP
jgi:hypothetical protein